MPNPETANTAGLVWLFPLTFLSNAFVPISSMPGWLQAFAAWNPISAVVLACRELFGNPTGIQPDYWPLQHAELYTLLSCTVLIAIFAPLAVRRYRHSTSRQAAGSRRSPAPFVAVDAVAASHTATARSLATSGSVPATTPAISGERQHRTAAVARPRRVPPPRCRSRSTSPAASGFDGSGSPRSGSPSARSMDPGGIASAFVTMRSATSRSPGVG
jgi:hypothetical protein